MDTKRKKIIGISIVGVLLAGTAALFIFLGKPMLQFLSNPDAVRAWVDGAGWWSRLAFVGMMVLQVCISIIPGEPLEICAGYAFGAIEGSILCLVGAVIGTAIIFLFTRRFGLRLAGMFFPVEKLKSIKFLQDSRRVHLLTFILFFIPGTPKDLMTYVLGATSMTLPACLLITGFARIPSVITSTIGGNALGTGSIGFAVIVFAITAVISLCGILVFNHISKGKNTATKTVYTQESAHSTSN